MKMSFVRGLKIIWSILNFGKMFLEYPLARSVINAVT